MPASFGDRLKELRISKNMTQQEFADFLGTTKQSISRYEAHKRMPKIEVAESFANRLSVDLYYLIGSKDVREGLNSNTLPGASSQKEEDNATLSPNRRALIGISETATDEEINMLLRLAKAVLQEPEK